MSSYLMRELAPFGHEMWSKIDEMVVRVAKGTLVGRRFIELVGPLGWGVEVAPLFGFDVEGEVAAAKEATYLPLKEIKKDFVLRAKQWAIAEQTPFAFDLGAVAIAGTALAQAEDKLIIETFAGQAGRSKGVLGDWQVPFAAFSAIAKAEGELLQNGFVAPYALVLGPQLYAQLASLIKDGQRELEMVEKLVEGGIFQTAAMPAGQALLLSLGAWNFDLVVGQDVITAYAGNEGLDQKCRVFESLALRIKRPGAIYLLK
jgi:uncharacterized linocin/CFP29 family protein